MISTHIPILLTNERFISRPLPPPGWTKYIHLEGARYFYNKAKVIIFLLSLSAPVIYQQTPENMYRCRSSGPENIVTRRK